MEINDKRKFTEDGELKEVLVDEPKKIVIADVQRVYDYPEPMTNHCLVKQGDAETTYKGTKFIIPDSARQSPNEGVVVAIGPDIDAEKLQPGDLVIFGRFNAEPITVDDEEFQLVNFHDIKLRKRVTYATLAS